MSTSRHTLRSCHFPRSVSIVIICDRLSFFLFFMTFLSCPLSSLVWWLVFTTRNYPEKLLTPCSPAPPMFFDGGCRSYWRKPDASSFILTFFHLPPMTLWSLKKPYTPTPTSRPCSTFSSSDPTQSDVQGTFYIFSLLNHTHYTFRYKYRHAQLWDGLTNVRNGGGMQIVPTG